MPQSSRRRFVRTLPLAGLAGTVLPPAAWSLSFGQTPATTPAQVAAQPRLDDGFPRHDPAVVKEVVGASHSNLARVRELVERQPALADASWDWSFGDWETALGAASHTGRREIAELLLSHGAQPTMFSAAMLGQLDVVKAFVAARPGIQGTHGPHSITLLAHARAGGQSAALVVEYLEALGGADLRPPTAPLDPADRAAIVGEYRFGSGPRDRFTVDVQNDLVGVQRPGADRHVLLHAGGLVFFPTGATAVKLAFGREAARVTRLTVADPDVVLTAQRV